MIRPFRIAAPLLAFVALFTAGPAAAWWEYGHQTIATIAMAEVSPKTRAAIRRLIAQSPQLRTPTCPIRSIEDASVWPDCVKPLGDRFSYAYSWHYQNVDICKPFDIKTPCADGNCVSAQIERAARMLHDAKLPTVDRIEALAFLVHFVGDLHQPLHAGDRSDRGGNDQPANYGIMAGRRNLHTVWDGLLADRAISTPPGGALGVLSEIPAADRPAAAAGSVADWSRESWQASHTAYADLLGGDGCGPQPAGRPTLSNEAIAREIPLARRQVALGGLRLAKLLDEALGDVAPDPSRVPRPRRR
ncbi:S1/P1 nuclease [Sphingomonas prati]|uniref:Endonuclease n=1 Tax=Sphingomonas prati TaxID=1843237 RepID=A0A7W9F0Y5_9SPHN|nr:S1/P1 nuclease [Sphingomonas prati]MBB5728746.1 hypothetical protein [Sphingomonas prati]GGE87876.1 endonuclease [Sphingomonas prati]